jgi:hypothetical protein
MGANIGDYAVTGTAVAETETLRTAVRLVADTGRNQRTETVGSC